MKNFSDRFLLPIGVLFLLGCNSGNQKEDQQPGTESKAGLVQPAGQENGDTRDTSNSFVRTADLKYKVKDVIHTTYDLERIVSNHGGYISHTNLTSNINSIQNFAVSADSSRRVTNYSTTNFITLRIPNSKLDETLKEISMNVDFIDYRIINATDVTLDLITNEMAAKRAGGSAKRLINAISSKGDKLKDVDSAELMVQTTEALKDNSIISNLYLKEQVKFSTIKLLLYQNESVQYEMFANEMVNQVYKPGLWSRILTSLTIGWEILESIFLFLLRIWPFILVIFAAIWLYRRQSPGIVYPK